LPDLGHLFAGLQVALGLHEATHDAQGAKEILAVLALSRSGMVWESAIKTGVKKTSDPLFSLQRCNITRLVDHWTRTKMTKYICSE